jgi:hypothetical protein
MNIETVFTICTLHKNDKLISVLCVYLILVSGLVACTWRQVLRLLDPFTEDGMLVPNKTQN